ncbi:MAG: hypothetical protein FJZ01_08835 [Candidatus Sericytochromatia bacterium]|nr:hypothetical protein [Candidatus Tanganyikabacteria bacterium]
MPSLAEDLRTALRLTPTPDVEALTGHFREVFGPALCAVVMYGSCRNEETRKASSIYDFFLICDDYRAFRGKGRDAVLSGFLPPNVYYLELPALQPGCPDLACKYNVLSLAHLETETSRAARDLFLIGRLGKRVGITYARDPSALEKVVACVAEAMRHNVCLIVPLLPPELPLDEFVRRLLALSYASEFRIERSTKVVELFEADKAHYLRFYRELLAETRVAEIRDDSTCVLSLSATERGAGARRTAAVMRRSRRPSVLRWAKNTLTFNDFVGYFLRKLERTAGIRLELTAHERKYPLLLGWKHLIRLARLGLLK